MRLLLILALVGTVSCGDSGDAPGVTVITITFPAGTEPYPDITCVGDAPPTVRFAANPCGFTPAGDCELVLDLRPGPCKLRVPLQDVTTGDTICVQEPEFIVAPTGVTNVSIMLDDAC